MKKLIISSILALLFLTGRATIPGDHPAEYLGLPGDNLNLYAVMNLFQESKTLEDFERSLNDPNSRINNLDLNGDNLVDYISVIDYPDRDVHNIVLQVALNSTEKQDVAVFTVQRFQNGSVQIQLVGDEALYGKNYIIEPNYTANNGETPNPGYTGNVSYVYNSDDVGYTTYQIAAWPLVRFIFLPGYIPWHSSWYWGYYPSYWYPWRPFYWDYYYGFHYNFYPSYYRHFRLSSYNRYTRYNDYYYRGVRSYSDQVSRRISRGDYRATYSHPEQRRNGEALYSRVYAGRNSAASRRAPANGNDRRGTYSSLSRNANVSNRSSASTAGRRVTNSYSVPNTHASGRSYASASGSRVTNSYSAPNSGASRRSSGTTAGSRVTNSYSAPNSGASRRSSGITAGSRATNSYSASAAKSSRNISPAISNRGVTRSGQGSRTAAPSRSVGQSGPRMGTTGQRSTSHSSRGTSSSGQSKSSASANSESSHRR